MKLIVGLGNPGDEYKNVRHNLGFMVLDELAKSVGSGRWEIEKKFNSLALKASEALLVKPQTFMNNSGDAVRRLADYFKINTEDIIIVNDELDLPLGKIQLRSGGIAAGHHGVESIIDALGTDQFIRIRIGIGPSVGESDKFVLDSFTKEEEKRVKEVVRQAALAVTLLLEKGLEEAQNKFN